MAAGAVDGEIFLWRRDDSEPLATSSVHVSEVTGIGFAGNGDRLFSASADGSVRAWSAEGLSLLFSPEDFGPYLIDLLTRFKEC